MTPEERLSYMNNECAVEVERWLVQLDEGNMTGDDLFICLYSSMIVAFLAGYNPSEILKDAAKAAQKIKDQLKDTESEEVVDK